MRQGLKKAQNVLLEPFFRFEITTPAEDLSRILYELETRRAKVQVEEMESGKMRITGRGPVSTLDESEYDTCLPFQRACRYFRGKSTATTAAKTPRKSSNRSATTKASTASILRDRYSARTVSALRSNGMRWKTTCTFRPWTIPRRFLRFRSTSSKVSAQELNRVFQNAGGSNHEREKSRSIQKETNRPVARTNAGYDLLASANGSDRRRV